MPLYQTNDPTIRTEAGENALAKDQDGLRVIVATTDEAIRDYGWPTIWAAAGEKYGRGELEATEPIPRVRITTTDCAALAAPDARGS
jgi:hypothetical protein